MNGYTFVTKPAPLKNMNPEITFRYLKAIYCTDGYFNSAVKKARVHVDAAPPVVFVVIIIISRLP